MSRTITNLRQYFIDNGLDWDLFVELVENGVSAYKISDWHVNGKRAFNRSRHSIDNYIKKYWEGKP
jgi:hypothetical protein